MARPKKQKVDQPEGQAEKPSPVLGQVPQDKLKTHPKFHKFSKGEN